MSSLKDVLVYDIETYTPSGKPDPEKDELRYIGFRFPSGEKKIFHFSQIEAIQNIISSHRFISGHYILGYDNPVLSRESYNIKFKTYGNKNVIPIDTHSIIDKRAKQMMYLDLEMGEKSLKKLAQRFKLPSQKGEMDFKMLKKPFLVGEEYEEMKKYLEGDLDTSYELLKYLYNTFHATKKRVSLQNQQNMSWLTCASGTLGYKIYCHQKGVPEIYKDKPEKSTFIGAIMHVHPTLTYAEDIEVYDFRALYPNVKIMNILSERIKEGSYDIDENGEPVTNDKQWCAKGTIFEGFVKGVYKRELSKYEIYLRDDIILRASIKEDMKKLQKGSPEWQYEWYEQNGIKIGMNAGYGAGGNPVFQSMYDVIGAGDTTGSARALITDIKNYLENFGYVIIYQHTDSLYIIDKFKDRAKLDKLINERIEFQRTQANYYNPLHGFDHEDSLKKLWLIQNDKGGNVKNRNIRLYSNDTFGYTGIKIKSGSCSGVAKVVFDKYITEELKVGKTDLFFDTQKLIGWIKVEAERDYTLLNRRYRVFPMKSYKSTTSIQFQMAKIYGEGEHFLISNKFLGAGKSVKYCKVEELKKTFGDKWTEGINYMNYLKDLKEFIHPSERKKIK